jgi:hypothetical protein
MVGIGRAGRPAMINPACELLRQVARRHRAAAQIRRPQNRRPFGIKDQRPRSTIQSALLLRVLRA